MSRGKRSKEDYEREIEEAAKRMKKYPEYLEATKDSEDWIDFLKSIGITTSGADFWQDVRDRAYKKEVGFKPRVLQEHRVEYDPRGRGSKFRSNETGRFVSRESLEKAW